MKKLRCVANGSVPNRLCPSSMASTCTFTAGRRMRSVSMMALLLVAPGCSQQAASPPHATGMTATSPAAAPSEAMIASWRTFLSNMSTNYERLGVVETNLSKQDNANSKYTYKVTGDLKKSDSVLDPYVGVVTLYDHFWNSTGSHDTIYLLEFSFDGSKWHPKAGSLEQKSHDSINGKDKTTKKVLTAQDIEKMFQKHAAKLNSAGR